MGAPIKPDPGALAFSKVRSAAKELAKNLVRAGAWQAALHWAPPRVSRLGLHSRQRPRRVRARWAKAPLV